MQVDANMTLLQMTAINCTPMPPTEYATTSLEGTYLPSAGLFQCTKNPLTAPNTDLTAPEIFPIIILSYNIFINNIIILTH